MLSTKSLRLDVLDQSRRVVTRATGFLLHEQDWLSLYTCWHVVTGVDFLKPHPTIPPSRRAFITVHLQNVTEPQPGLVGIGGSRSIEVGLYDVRGNPVWQQESGSQEQPDLEAIGLRVPRFFDLVRIPVSLEPLTAEIVGFRSADVFPNLSLVGTDVLVGGYPYGYSATDFSPEPIFLKRAIAANRTFSIGAILLDGGATPGMSGAPVHIFYEGKWWLMGVYSGVLFPDHLHGPTGPSNDRFAALGLMVPINRARIVMQVPGTPGNN